MSELKPCQNNMCIANNIKESYNCGYWYIKSKKQMTGIVSDMGCMETCSKYLSEKPETAWERRWKRLKDVGIILMRKAKETNSQMLMFAAGIFNHNISKIEKELRDD